MHPALDPTLLPGAAWGSSAASAGNTAGAETMTITSSDASADVAAGPLPGGPQKRYGMTRASVMPVPAVLTAAAPTSVSKVLTHNSTKSYAPTSAGSSVARTWTWKSSLMLDDQVLESGGVVLVCKMRARG